MKYFESFFVCPNCKEPLCRKKAMKEGSVSKSKYCRKCGAKIASAKKKAQVKAGKRHKREKADSDAYQIIVSDQERFEKAIDERSKSKSASEKVRSKDIDLVLKHFGVEVKKAFESEVFCCDNNDFFKEKIGIDWIVRSYKTDQRPEIKKVQIIIDYDVDFQKILIRVKPR